MHWRSHLISLFLSPSPLPTAHSIYKIILIRISLVSFSLHRIQWSFSGTQTTCWGHLHILDLTGILNRTTCFLGFFQFGQQWLILTEFSKGQICFCTRFLKSTCNVISLMKYRSLTCQVNSCSKQKCFHLPRDTVIIKNLRNTVKLNGKKLICLP